MAPAFPVVLAGVLLVVETGVLSLSASDDLEGVAGTFSGSAEEDIFPSSSKSRSTMCGSQEKRRIWNGPLLHQFDAETDF
jgi:hypothetical protein